MRRATARLTSLLKFSPSTSGATLDTCTRASATSTRQPTSQAPLNAARYLSQQLGSHNGQLPRGAPRLETRTSSVTVLLCGVSFATAAYASAQAYGWAHDRRADEWHWPDIHAAPRLIGAAPEMLVDALKSWVPGGGALRAPALAEAPPTPPMFGPYAIADAAAKVAPAVVNIVRKDGADNRIGSGSGFIFDANGHILTNAHVVGHYPDLVGMRAPSATRTLLVTLQDGRQYDGTVVSVDRLTDLAVVKITDEEPLPAVQLGCSAGLRAGEWVVAVGSPLSLQNTVTHGIVSCVDRKAVELGLAGARTDFIQTDAAINVGNSGGPLVNLRGEVIGIANMKAIAADGVSFAIPVDSAKQVVAQLLTVGRVVRPYLGIKMLQLDADRLANLKRKEETFPDVKRGILVPFVTPGSPADKAGLRAGDVVIGFDGCQGDDVSTSAIYRELQKRVGHAFGMTVRRGQSTHVLSVQVVEAP